MHINIVHLKSAIVCNQCGMDAVCHCSLYATPFAQRLQTHTPLGSLNIFEADSIYIRVLVVFCPQSKRFLAAGQNKPATESHRGTGGPYENHQDIDRHSVFFI